MIRYTTIGRSYWYSLNDIRTFLVKEKAILATKELHSRLLKLMAKNIYSQTTPSDSNLWIGLKPSDLFISKHGVKLIKEVCSDKEKSAISGTRILMAIDFSNSMEKDFPEIYKLMKRVVLVDLNEE